MYAPSELRAASLAIWGGVGMALHGDFSGFGWRSNRLSALGLSPHRKRLWGRRAAQKEGDAGLPAIARRFSPPFEVGTLSAL